MFDIGTSELLLVAVITLLVVGPKEIPRVVRGVSAFLRQCRYMASQFQSHLTSIADEADVKKLQSHILQDTELQSDLQETQNVFQHINQPYQTSDSTHTDQSQSVIESTIDKDNLQSSEHSPPHDDHAKTPSCSDGNLENLESQSQKQSSSSL